MKHKIVTLGLMLSFIAKAQVGINTHNTQGVFHVDALGNNAITGTPTTAQMTDDIVIAANTSTGINMSIGGKVATNSSAQLALLDPNKAILLNRVALTDLRDITTIPDPLTGTIVYNTATSGTYPDNIVPGYYYFNGVVWYKWQYGRVDSELSQRDLLTACNSTEVPGLNDSSSPMLAALADFGTITIEEDGVYIFSFRLYGYIVPITTGGSVPTFTPSRNYLYMMKNSSTKVDAIEINVASILGGTGLTNPYTHTATMQAVFSKDDDITFRLGHAAGWYGWLLRSNPALNSVKTSLIYWKI